MEDEVVRIEIDAFDKLSIIEFSIVSKTLVGATGFEPVTSSL